MEPEPEPELKLRSEVRVHVFGTWLRCGKQGHGKGADGNQNPQWDLRVQIAVADRHLRHARHSKLHIND